VRHAKTSAECRLDASSLDRERKRDLSAGALGNLRLPPVKRRLEFRGQRVVAPLFEHEVAEAGKLAQALESRDRRADEIGSRGVVSVLMPLTTATDGPVACSLSHRHHVAARKGRLTSGTWDLRGGFRGRAE
jgi:hypothetical protein